MTDPTTTAVATTSIALTIPNAEALPPSMLSNIHEGFQSAFEQAEAWREKALAVKVTSLADKEAMKQAREMRLALKNIRVEAEKKRKTLKEDALVMGRAIDGVNNLLLAAIQPLERHLEEQEKFAERLAEQERQRRLAERTEALQPYLEAGQAVPALDVMTDDQFAKYLDDAKILHAAKIEAAKKAEAERIAREQAEAAERERLRIENERLRAEAAEREAKAKAEREAAERAQREAAEKARKEREAIEAKAKAEREAAERELVRIKAESEAAAANEREARAKLEAELAAKKAAEEAKAQAEAAAAKEAAAAPDKAKLRTIAASVRKLDLPTVSTSEGEAVLAEIKAKIEGFAKWIETQTEKL
jgi:colicin import membrane protein